MITACMSIWPTLTNINPVDMRNFIFSIILLWSLTAFSQVAIAQEKVLTLSEAEALLEKAQQKYSKAKDAYRKSLKTGEETTTLKALRSASRKFSRFTSAISYGKEPNFPTKKLPSFSRIMKSCKISYSVSTMMPSGK